ncbi:MAG: tRNA pseudouridine(38-40) synthase TruA [Candidatus Improbicoccus devescovinae]|nr:MAG: tRNA pseudouridine(38-40) synthase TruA [Candidatus Improbicoccus devescovinae]
MSKIKNFLVIISYVGTKYHGWQIQKNAITVQEVFQNALRKIVKSNVDVKGCSRTDAGVHANMYCVSFKIFSSISPGSIIHALNSLLPDDIVVKSCFQVSEDFHARYSCVAKEYVYKLYYHKIKDPFMADRVFYYPYKFNFELLKDACEFFVGKHDFSAFCCNNIQYKLRKNYDFVREILCINIKKYAKIIEFNIKANGFLFRMARIIVGTLLEIARNKIHISDLKIIFDSKNRKNAGPTLPACGLYLNNVSYQNIRI